MRGLLIQGYATYAPKYCCAGTAALGLLVGTVFHSKGFILKATRHTLALEEHAAHTQRMPNKTNTAVPVRTVLQYSDSTRTTAVVVTGSFKLKGVVIHAEKARSLSRAERAYRRRCIPLGMGFTSDAGLAGCRSVDTERISSRGPSIASVESLSGFSAWSARLGPAELWRPHKVRGLPGSSD